MGTTSFIEMLLYLLKRIKLITAFAVLGVIVAFALASISQEYTATVGIQYAYPAAEEALDPLGGKLNVYEVMNPSVIATALRNMESNLSTEEVRNKLAISPVIASKEQEAQQAKIALGEVVPVTATVYNVSFTCKGSLGSAFAQRFLYYLLQSYDEFFSRKYLEMRRTPDFMEIVDVDAMDYMEKCAYIDEQIMALTGMFDELTKHDQQFTSKRTGLDFAALRSFYFQMRTNEYDRLYANVRVGLLTKNKELLIQGYKKRIEELELERKNRQDESNQAHGMVLQFYEQYKKNNLYYQAMNQQQVVSDEKADNKNLVYDFDLTLMMNTYDDMLLRYVSNGVTAATTRYEIERYQNLIAEFAADAKIPDQKTQLFSMADSLILEISALSKKYAELANQTLADYYGANIAKNVKYMMAVEVSPTVSTSMYMVVGFFVMLLVGAAFAIVLEIVVNQLKRRKFELLLSGDGEGLTPEIMDSMSPLEHSFYEQVVSGFTEFYLMYQPIVHNGAWEISETLVRWESRHRGQIMPDEFIPIAEKYKLMGRLGEWILKEACRQSIAWVEAGVMCPCVSVNYSAQQIESQQFIDSVCRIVTESKVNPANIWLEISGGGELHNVEQVASKFVALKALGLRLTIDRFGESMSSLRMLYELPADMVKLDKRFLTALGDPNDKNAALLSRVIAVCNELGLLICCNGIEEPWQVERLEAMGATYLQGFFFSSPLPAEAYEERHRLYVGHAARAAASQAPAGKAQPIKASFEAEPGTDAKPFESQTESGEKDADPSNLKVEE